MRPLNFLQVDRQPYGLIWYIKIFCVDLVLSEHKTNNTQQLSIIQFMIHISIYTKYTLCFYSPSFSIPSNKTPWFNQNNLFFIIYQAAAPGNSKGSISTNQLSPQTTWHRKCQGSWQFGWMENGEEMAGEPRKIALKNFAWSKLKVVFF